MNLEDLMEVWRSQDAAPVHGVNETLLRLALRQDEAKLQAQRRRERWIACLTSALHRAVEGITCLPLEQRDDTRLVSRGSAQDLEKWRLRQFTNYIQESDVDRGLEIGHRCQLPAHGFISGGRLTQNHRFRECQIFCRYGTTLAKTDETGPSLNPKDGIASAGNWLSKRVRFESRHFKLLLRAP